MPDSSSTFLKLAGSLDYPILIVTTTDGQRREGCVVGFSTHTSFAPERFLACLSRANRTYRLALETDALAVHVVPRDGLALAELFGGETGDETDKFARCAWRAGPRGLPILDGCASWFAGSIVSRHDLGDHVGFLLEPFEAELDEHAGQLSVQQVRHIEPGHPA